MRILSPRAAVARAGGYLAGFPSPIWLLTAASTLEATGRFMVVPYLSLYLSGKGVSLGVLGLILGAGPVASVAFGAFGGHLSDRWGRKPVQILGVCSSGLALVGFAFAGADPVPLALLNFLNGMTRTFYRPATSAAISDLCPRNRLAEAFALNRIAVNAAFGWGPLIGVALFATSPRTGFLVAGGANLLVGLFLALAVPESRPRPPGRGERERARLDGAGPDGDRTARGGPVPAESAGHQWREWKEVLADRSFWIWNAAMMCVWGAYDLIQSFLPLHLAARGLPLWLYGSLLSANALVCVFGQLPASRAVRSSPIGPVAAATKMAFAIGFVGFAFFRAPALLLASMLVLSFGEIVGSGVHVRFVPERAPSRLLGRYMGLSVTNELGRAIVAPAAGFLMQAAGGEAVFAAAALISLLGGGLAWLAAAPAAERRAG